MENADPCVRFAIKPEGIMLTEHNIKRHYDSKDADSVYGKLKGRNQELKVDLFKRAARTMLCLLLFGPLLEKFARP